MNDQTVIYSQPQDPETIEINLKDMFWSIIKRFRSILVVMLALGILLGGFQGGKLLLQRFDKAAMKKAQANYEKDKETYQIQKDQYNLKIDNIKREITAQEGYLDTALLLKADPFNVYTEVLTFYISTGYQIMPEVSFQNPNYTGSMVTLYRSVIDRIDYDTLLTEANGSTLTVKNPVSGSSKQVVTTNISTDNGTLVVRVIADTKENADLIVNAIYTAVDNAKEAFTEKIGEHEISVMTTQSAFGIDLDLVELQKTYSTNMETLATNLKKANQNLKNLEAPVNNVPSKANIIKTTIQWGLIGLVLGAFLMFVIYAIRFITSDQMVNPEEINRRYQTSVLGYLPPSAPRKKNLFTAIDKGVLKRLNIKAQIERDEAEKIISANTSLYSHGADKILVLGTASKEKIEDVANVLKAQLENVEVTCGGNVLENAYAIQALSSKSPVVFVEATSKSRHTEIRKEITAVKASESEIAGVVIV